MKILKEKLQNLKKNKYDVLYNQETAIPQASGKLITITKNPQEENYKYLIVQVFNSFSREIFVHIPSYEFTEVNHHYNVVSATNNNTLDVLRISPIYNKKQINFVYDKYGEGLSVRRIVGVY